MMHFLGRRKPSSLTALLTKKMSLYVSVTDTFPTTTITLLSHWVTLIFVIAIVHSLLMLIAVAVMGELRAACMITGSFWFCWHMFDTSFGYNKSPHR